MSKLNKGAIHVIFSRFRPYSLILDSDSSWCRDCGLVRVASPGSLRGLLPEVLCLLSPIMPKTQNMWLTCLSVSLPGNGCASQKRSPQNFDFTFCSSKCRALQCVCFFSVDQIPVRVEQKSEIISVMPVSHTQFKPFGGQSAL